MTTLLTDTTTDPRSFVEILANRAGIRPEGRAYTFLSEGEEESVHLTYGELDRRARAIGAALQQAGLAGERALLLYPPGLDFITAFYGCLYGGVVAVPCYPPRLNRTLARLLAIVEDSQCRALLAPAALRARSAAMMAQAPGLADLMWLSTDDLPDELAGEWRDPQAGPDDLAFLQYTSGSTSTPKGVMVSHGNLLHNEMMIRAAAGMSEESVTVGWLPLYHDMGLIGNVLQSVYSGAHCVLMSPMAFLQRPARWLEAVSRYRATLSGGPDFAYELCVRKIGPEQRAKLDLSSWRVAFNGAEPVRAVTLERFSEAFAPCGFRPETFFPCYGLAEATLFVAGGPLASPPVIRNVRASALERHRIEEAEPGDERLLAGSGRPWPDQEVAIADPETGARCAAGTVGEIWVAGPSVARGYWNRPEINRELFGARLLGEEGGPFLRTGDLGFLLDGELFVTGRRKDLIILRGRNLYPQDVELAAERSHAALRTAGGAAFSVETERGEEALVVVLEVEPRAKAPAEEIALAVRRAVAEEHEAHVEDVVLISAGTLPRTTSGKVQRHRCRIEYLEGGLTVVGRSRLGGTPTDLELAAAEAEEPAEDPGRTDLVSSLRGRVARLLGVPAEVLEPDVPLSSFGLDSLMAVSLRGAVESAFGADLSLELLLSGPSLAELAGVLASLLEDAPAAETVPLVPLAPANHGPLSHGQRALWFLHGLTAETAAYHIAGAARIEGTLDAAALRRAFQALLDRHGALRTTFGEEAQRIAEQAEVAFDEHDAEGWSEDAFQTALRDEALRPFDLARGPLFRVSLWRRSATEHVLGLAVHHIAADFWSMAVLLRELGTLYGGGSLEPLPLTYTDYAVWQERMLASPRGERLWSYWRHQLAGGLSGRSELADLDLPTDRPRPPAQTFRGATRLLRLDGELTAGLKALAAERGAAPSMLLGAAFAALIHRITGRTDFLVGSPTAGRGAPELAGLVGYFVNQVALRADLSGSPSFEELLGRMRRTMTAAWEHQDYPFSLLAERLRPVRDPSRPPLTQVMFSFQRAHQAEERELAAFALGESGARLALGGLELTSVPLDLGTCQLDFTLEAADLDGGILTALRFNLDLFDEATAEHFLGHFQMLLAGAAAAPDSPVAHLPLLTAEERSQLAVWNGTERDFGPAVPVHRLVEEAAARNPEALAISDADAELEMTHRELQERANQLAHWLRRAGVGPESRVGVLMERSAAQVVSSLAVLKAGGAYLPLDPGAPPDRLAFMAGDAGIAALLHGPGQAGRLPDPGVPTLALDAGWQAVAGESTAPLDEDGDDAEGDCTGRLAYVIYTSGSTGRPKGVEVEHGSLLNLVRWHQRVYGVTAADRAPQVAAPVFDAAVWEVWPYLCAGASVHIPSEEVRTSPDRLIAWLAAERITLAFLPTPAAEAVLDRPWPEDLALRALLTGGDRLRRAPGADLPFRLLNHYGPTEATVVTTWAEAMPDADGPPPIGRPVDNLRVHVLDAAGEPVPVGVPGELYVSGGLARGYLGRPELTAERFLPDPSGTDPSGIGGGRLYRTGDLVRRRPDGALDFLGRLDQQVKVRGYRIEAGEIEALLRSHPDVHDAVVVPRPDAAGEVRLAAYVVGQATAEALRAHLRTGLPEYMVPAAFVTVESLPLTANGKVDRAALPAPDWSRPESGGEWIAPRTATEEVLAALWAGLLEVERVGVHDDFFELGGHSLKAGLLVSRLREAFGIELPLAELFANPTLAGLAAVVEAARRDGSAPAAPPLRPAPRHGDLPLSSAQERLWFLDRLAPGGAVYNIPLGLRLRGPLDVAALARALDGIERRHEAMRAVFHEAEGRAVQRLAPPAGLPLEVVDAAGPEDAERLAREAARRPFDLATGPLARATLIRLGAEDHLLLLNLHHIAGDGVSVGVLLRELEALYEGVELPEPPVQYADWAAWQREWLTGEALEARLDFWRGHLEGAPPALDLPTDRPRPAAQAFRGEMAPAALSPGLARNLRKAARREGATLYMAVLAGLAAVLQHWSGQEDVVIGSPVANRAPEVEGLIGCFVNTLPLRVALGGDPSFRELLAGVRNAALGGFAHQDVPFERLVEEMQPRRDLSRGPLFQVMLALQDGPGERPRLAGLEAEPLPFHLLHTGTAKFDLTLALNGDGGEGLSGGLEMDSALFDEATGRRLLGHLETWLAAAAADPQAPIASLPILTAAESAQLLEWNATAVTFPRDRGLHEFFWDQAERTPGAVALIWGTERISYGELRGRAEAIARRLHGEGVGPEVRVGVFSRRTPDLIAALLGVLRAGGAYVPLDPEYPAERLAFLLEDSGAAAVLVQEELIPSLPPYAGRVLALGGEGTAQGELPRGWIHPEQNAYLIYTSGSTGRPKAVAIRHASAAARVAWAVEAFGERLVRTLAATSVCFDLSVFEIFAPLAMGGAVVLADNALALPELPAADEVTLVNTVPSAMAELARARALPASVKVVNLAGEPLRRELADRIHELPGVEELWNLYGPSEDTTYSTGARIDRENRRAPAIGQPLPNSRAHLLDSVLRPVPVGVPGELWMGGEGVARGYLGRPDLTADRFRPDPFTTAPGGGRLYRTGDLARRRPDGEIEFLGRADHQVKIRGFRIEPGEVEALLGGHPQVSEAVVVARENAAGDPRLVAYVTAETDAGVLRAWLAARLPAHMVPASWVLLEEMPRTPNGKVDRKALPAPETETAAIEDDGPLSPAEQAVAEIWCEVLGLPRVSRHGNFFELGGHSLLAVRAASRLRDLAGADLPLRALFEAPTVAAMAARLELSGTVVAEPPVRRVGRDAPLPLSFTQERLWFIDQLEPGSAVYNLPLALRLRGPLDVEALGAAWDGIVRRHEALRTTFALVDGRPVQVIAPTAPPLERIDPENIEDEARRPFDLANGPLARAVLASIGEDDHLLLAVFHHAVFDGVSAGIFLRDLAALYAGETLPELPVQYADWAVWQRARLDGGLLGERLGFWREQLAGAPEALELPTDRPRPAVRSSRGAALPAGLPEGLLRALRTVAGRDGATLFMALLGGFAAVLQRWTGQDDAVIGSPVANRSRAEAEGLIGCLVNTLPLRVDASGDPSFRELLGRVRSTVLAASAHEDVPFERLVEELQPRRDLSRTPLFQAMLAFQDGPAARPELPGLTVADVPLHTGTAKFDLTLALNGDGTGGLEMDAGLFDAATGSRLLGHLETWLTAAAADPEAPIAGLPVLTAAESAQILEWHATEAAFPRDRGLHELFWDQAERTPGDVALIWGTERTSYGELRGRAEAIASRLRGEGVGPEVRVGVFSRRTPDLIAALLGVLRAGGAYVPLDPEYPPERLAFLLEDSGAAAVLVQEELISSLPPFAGRVLMLGGEEASERELPRGWIHPDQNAYLIYTSGSTGRPKAVAIRHESAVARVAWSLETYGERLARTLAATSVCFDLSVFEIFAPLAMGGAVVLADNALALPELPAADEVTLVNTVPSAMAELARARALPASVRVVNLAGEPLRRELADRVHELPGVEELWNLYGPSEDTTYSTAARIGKGDRQAPAVGRPLANSRVHLLDALLRPVPVGVPGEGWIAGDGVSRGYLGRPDLTADRFRPDPFATAPGGGRLYRTGDLLRRRPDGEIEFLGRADHQVKIRGFRIEPGEIEAVLGGHPHISEAVVIAREDVPGDLRLVAYVTATETDASELRAWLAARLPAHMVPAAWVLLEEMPRTPNGKVDRKALPAPEAAAAISDGDETLSPVEEVVAGIWCDVLGLTRVGRHDGFFELGGHSLLAAQVSARLRAAFGVEVPLHALFETPTVAGLAESVQGLLRTGLPPAPPLVPAPRSPEMPLSFAQERLWFIDQLEPGTALYNIPAAVRLRGALDVSALAAALTEIVRRHEVLRTSFASVDGRPVQRIAPPAAVPLARTDLANLPDPAAEARRLTAAEAGAPFDLARGPVVRFQLLRLGVDEHVLLVNLHHIAADGWSAGVLVRELTALYGAFAAGRPSPLPPLPGQYADFAAWQRSWLEADAERQLAFWRQRLAGAPAALELPADRPRPAVSDPRGGRYAFALPAGLSRDLQALARREGATLFMTLLAAFTALLSRLGGQDDVVVGTAVANRDRVEIEPLIGFFVNSLPLRVPLGGSPGLRELLGRTRETTLAAYAHQDLPFERLVEDLQPGRDLALPPLFQAMLVLQNAPLPALELPGLSIETLEADSGMVKLPLSLSMMERDGALAGSLGYQSALFDPATARRIAGQLGVLLEAAVGAPDEPYKDLPLMPAPERHQVLVEWSAVPALPGIEQTIHGLIAAQAARTPEATAVACEGERLTYGELDRESNRLARRLRAWGVAPDDRVGLYMERSAATITAILAVLKAGGAYVPLDPSFPQERLEWMLEAADARVLLTHEALAGRPLATSARTLPVDERSLWADLSGAPLEGGAGPENLVYVMFTSGSTGRPKGVALEHRALVSYTGAVLERLRLPAGSSFATVSTLAADLGNTAVFPALTTGGCLHVVAGHRVADPLALAEYFGDTPVDCLKIVPSHLAALLSAPDPRRVLPRRVLVLGGEAAGRDLLERVRELAPECRIVNHYGPTEAAVGVLAGLVEELPDGGRPAPLGRPLGGVRIHLVDRCLQPVPRGVAGELVIGGASLARGYFGRPDLTAERFLPSPWGEAGARIYRTGDLARHLPDGRAELLGRIDGQVKIRGYRVEPGEVEAALLAHPAVRAAAVEARSIAGELRLVAYVVAEDQGARELAGFLRGRLPEAMVPAAFVPLAALPLTPNGKLDRRALPAPSEEAADGEVTTGAPRTPVEELLAGIWAGLLGRQRIGVEEDFFAAGGHSLLATRLASRVHQVFGVELPLRAIFEAPTLAAMAGRIGQAGRRAAAPPLEPARDSGESPLSFSQERLWFLEQLEPGTALYNLPYHARLEGTLDAGALASALSEIARRHAVLRTSFPAVAGRPVQRVAPPSAIDLPIEDLSALPEPERGEQGLRLAREEARRPFDLERGPLMRARLVRLAADEHLLLLSLHHAVSDAWSRGILVAELATLYGAFAAGRPSPLAEPALQYADFARWQRQWLQGEALEEQLDYWRRHLADQPGSLELPTDRPRPARRSRRGARRPVELPVDLTDLGRRQGSTLYMTVLAAFAALLHRYTGQNAIAVGSPVAGRNRAETEGLIGFFVNTLVLATDLGGDPAFGELLGRVREVALEAWARQDLPFEKLVSELRPDRDLGQTPFFQVTFVLQNAPQPPLALPGLSLTPLESDTGAAKFDLTLALAEDGRGGLSGLIEYDAELFDPATIARLEGHLGGLLAAAAADPGKRLWDLPMLGAAERHQLLLGANDTERPFPTAFVHELFADQARRTPSAVAVAAEDGTLTYAELDRRANGLAHRLARLGVGPDVRVGLCLERSLEMVVGLLGLLKAGGAYVPLDPEYPRERLDFMLEDSRAGVLLTQERFRERLAGAAETVLCLDGEPVAGGDPGPLAVRLAPENLAYLIYTSGSTGRPKGAMIPHGSLANHMLWMQERYPLAGDDSVLQKTPFSFDASVWEIWAPLLAGARLVMARPGGHRDAEYLAEALAEGGITTLQLVPAQLSILLREPGFAACRSLRRVYCGGEALPAALAAELRELLGVDAVNLYGPAETCIQVLSWTAERTSSGPTVPIGRPIDNARVHLLDRNLEPAPLGVPAELYVGGAALGRGYWQRPDLTAARFLPDPIGGEPGGRLYRTGDLARRRSDGALEFLDRVDQQVKVRGFRIELGEIEALLARHPAVREAAAGVHRGSHGDILAAWAVLRPGAAADAGELRAWLAAELPEFMVPAAFVFLPALPLSPSGKLDRRALPAPDGSAFGSGAGAAAPRTPVEELLAGLWSELLEVERVGIHDNFFQLGGHSLLAARLAARLRQSLRVDLPLRALFEAPTVAGLAALVESAQRVEALPPLAAVSREEALPLSPGQERLWFLQRLDPASAAYNLTSSFRLAGRLDVAALERCLAELTRRHEPLRTSFPERGGQPSQVIAPASSSEGLALVDLGGLPAAERTAEARRLTREAARRPFDLSRAPLLRTLLLRLAPEEHALLAVMHHIVGDGWSMGVLAREVGILYTAFAAGSPSPLAEPAVQYADFAAWQRRWLEDEAGAVDGQLAYWRRQLAGAPEPPVLPAARPRLILAGTPGTPGTAGEVLPFAIDPETSAELLRLSRREDATLFMTLLAAFDVLLYGLTGQTDLAVGTPVAGRRRVETEGLIGFFLNTLVLRGDLGGDPTFRELLARVRDVALDAYAHQDLPYERLVADLRGRDRSPLFRIWFVLQNTPAAALELPRLTLTSEEIGAGEVRHDLKLDLTETPQGLAGFFQYRRELFARGEVSHMAESFAALLRRVVGEPDLRLSDLAETVEEAGKTRMVRVEGDFQRSRQQELQSLTRSARRRSTAKDV